MKTFNPILIIFCLFLVPNFADAQKVKGMEGQMSGSGRSDSGGGSDDDWLFLIDLFFNFGFYPTYGLLFGFENEARPNERTFNEYPYADQRNGMYLPLFAEGRLGRGQAILHLQNNEDDVYGGYIQLKYSPDRFVTLDFNRLQLYEVLEDESNDWLSFNNFNVQFSRVHHPRFNLWWGGGLMVVDGEDTEASASLSGGFTWYFKKPLSLHAETQLGWPGNTFSRQHQARVQVHLNRFMIYAGYQGTKVGDVGVPSWSMGTGVWF